MGVPECSRRSRRRRTRRGTQEAAVIILGLVLLILGAILDISILWTIGIILVLVGAVLWLAGSMGHTVGPRAHYW
ncbi:DUF3040 domain-containing protein [Nocardioides sp.]|uniref:DUF3040 domain-containing protein n=1 Tax=Nocardioides sp. TaxID=35761 RepID=UPI002C74FBD1|nr:DUF3040 domain-containing protein [Nocardioides sp.]HSX67297.1 DUF3040 domain-containing protein [Nocardioides sp.]